MTPQGFKLVFVALVVANGLQGCAAYQQTKTDRLQNQSIERINRTDDAQNHTMLLVR